MRNRFLMVVHGQQSRYGRVGACLEQRGYVLERCCPVKGDLLPEGPEHYAGAVVFGGPMSANDCSAVPGIRDELDWIPGFVESGKPFLGVCLGAQLLARALGGSVAKHPEGRVEIGYYELHATSEGEDVFPGAMQVYHWHREGFEIPSGATLLATGEAFRNQAFQVGERTFGIQFHPEVTLEMLHDWTREPEPSNGAPGTQDRDTQLAGHSRYDSTLGKWLDDFIDGWL